MTQPKFITDNLQDIKNAVHGQSKMMACKQIKTIIDLHYSKVTWSLESAEWNNMDVINKSDLASVVYGLFVE